MDDFHEIDTVVKKLILGDGWYCELCWLYGSHKSRATHWGSRFWDTKSPWPLCEACYIKWMDMRPTDACMDQNILRGNWYANPDMRPPNGINHIIETYE